MKYKQADLFHKRLIEAGFVPGFDFALHHPVFGTGKIDVEQEGWRVSVTPVKTTQAEFREIILGLYGRQPEEGKEYTFKNGTYTFKSLPDLGLQQDDSPESSDV